MAIDTYSVRSRFDLPSESPSSKKTINPVRRTLLNTYKSRKRRCISSSTNNSHSKWRSLGIDQSELCLDLTLPTGQSFRWRQTGDSEYTGVVDSYLFTLRQTQKGIVEYMLHNHAQKVSDASKCATFPSITQVDGLVSDTPKCGTIRSITVVDGLVSNALQCIKTSSIADVDGLSSDTSKCDVNGLVPKAEKCDDSSSISDIDVGAFDGFNNRAEMALRDYLNLDTSLKDVWAPFILADARFAALAPYMVGARLLRQRPLECLFEFICSSNNHIQRITQMVDHLASFGPYLGTVKGFAFHAFPTLDDLECVTEDNLRAAGFGYRAKYIVGTVKALQSKTCGGEEWLYSLRSTGLDDAVESLCALPGVGPKVAACIALFSLDQHHAIPVDTHVWQIATRYITPELAGERLTPKLHAAVSEAFVKRFGKYAGWAQNVLFIAELASHQHYLPEDLRAIREKKPKKKIMKKGKSKDDI